MPTLNQMFPRKPWQQPKQQHLCLCGSPATTFDHFWPRHLGGRSFITGNTWRMCAACNQRKSARFPSASETLAFCLQRNLHKV